MGKNRGIRGWAIILLLTGSCWMAIDLGMAVTSRTDCKMTILKGQGWKTVINDLEHCGYRTGLAIKITARTGILRKIIGSPKPGLLHCNRNLGHCLNHIAHTRILAMDVEPGMTAWEVSKRIATVFEIPDYMIWGLLNDPILALQAGINVHKDTISAFEGFLGPGLFRFDSSLTPAQLMQLMAMQKIKTAKTIKPANMSMHRFLTLASMVQKEGSRPSDMAKIARVFMNRLRIRMPLQSDPTMVYLPYGLKIRPCPALRKDKENPYNTYAHRGLPPGPICCAGIQAMKAVAKPYNGPGASNLLYFVAKGDGTHVFSRTFREHKRAIRKFLRRKRGLGR